MKLRDVVKLTIVIAIVIAGVAMGERINEYRLEPSDGVTNDYFGLSVSLDGNRALVGAPLATNNAGVRAGAVYVFESGNTQEVAKLTASDGLVSNYFGYSVSLYGDRALVGAPQAKNGNGAASGAAYVFEYSNGSWVQVAKLVSSDGHEGDSFGYSVSLYGDRALVGARRVSNGVEERGAAYVFEYSNGSWVQVAKLVSSDTSDGNPDLFGSSVSLYGDRALVGAPGAKNDQFALSGAAYVFEYTNSTWVEKAKLLSLDSTCMDYFGTSVSLDGNLALVGATGATNGAGATSGAAYVFEYSNGSWVQRAKLLPSDGSDNNWFGNSVSLRGSTAMIGAPWAWNDVRGNWCGAVYIFHYDAGPQQWVEDAKLLSSDGVSGDRFGYSVSLGDDIAVVGTRRDDKRGCVYVYTPQPAKKTVLIWQSPSGSVTAWLINTNGAREDYVALYTGTSSWEVKGVADMDGDDIPDLVWQNPQNGQVVIWYLRVDGRMRSYAYVYKGTTSWRVRGVGRFDGDSVPDLIWQYPSSGAVAVWYMNTNGTMKSSKLIYSGSTLWKVQACGDMDGDGICDLVWQAPGGQVTAWLMNVDGTRKGYWSISTKTSTWQVRVVSDIDGDGIGDLIWQYPSTGAVAAWYLNANGSLRSTTYIYNGKTLWQVRCAVQ